MHFISKEISWLSFNNRVLQEAGDPSVELFDRIKFLGIYSSNLDDFFEIRVATLKKLVQLGKKQLAFKVDTSSKEILEKIEQHVINERIEFDKIFNGIIRELERQNIFFLNEKQLNEKQKLFARKYFKEKVRPMIFPVLTHKETFFPVLNDKNIYLTVRMYESKKKKWDYSIIEIPTDILPRFILLPKEKNEKDQFIIMLEDIIRFSLADIFATFSYSKFEAYEFKFNRDADFDIDDDITESYINKVNKGLKKRKKGLPVRFTYDVAFPKDMLTYITQKLNLSEEDSVIPGGRYHNTRDFNNFPAIIMAEAEDPFSALKGQILHKDLTGNRSILSVIREKDILLHFPYHSFDYIIDLLREAALDENVKSIKMTLYRVATNSSVINALINARRNRKEVTVLLELQARFDEEANIHWAKRLKEEGINVITGINGLKVHAKLCLITCLEQDGRKKYLKKFACVGTGNFNEQTAKIYIDRCLLTSDKRITREVAAIFEFLEHTYMIKKIKHITLSPFSMRTNLYRLINVETENALQGKKAYIYLKINNMADYPIIKQLYKAGQAGVEIRIIGRSMLSLVPGIKYYSENIKAISIVDKFLEHDRMYIFCNEERPRYFISSGDWLPRNFDRRIEVTCPIYDKALQQELNDIFKIAWNDNVKARVINEQLNNLYKETDQSHRIRSQLAIGHYLKKLHSIPSILKSEEKKQKDRELSVSK